MRQEVTFQLTHRSAATRIAIAFIIWSALWVVVSDYVLEHVARFQQRFWTAQTEKGLFYVFVSGLLLWLAVRAVEREEAARRQITESKLRLLKESGLIGVASWGEDRRFNYVNEALSQMLGYRRSELIGQEVRSLIPEEYVLSLLEAQEELRLHGRTSLHKGELIRKDGTTVPIVGGAGCLPGSSERTGYFVDISELTESEEERRQLSEKLLHSEKLNAIGQLAGGVAHNFNNELAIIVGYSSMIDAAAEGDEVCHDRAQQVLKAAERARKLVGQLLAFSRKQELHREVIDVNLLLEEMRSMLRQVLDARIELRLTLSEEEECIDIDPSQFEQAIVNLAVNAQQAMPTGGILTIDVGHRNARVGGINTPEQPYVTVTLSDTGCGMTPATQARLFEPFFTTRQKSGGTGLGLSTAHGIVKQSGGDILIASELDKGTTFTLLFPRSESKPAPPVELKPVRSTEAMTATVLLVEDMDAVREMMAQILASKGLAVISAMDGLHAVEIARSQKNSIDLVLTDVVMPRMSGPEAVHQIRQSHPEIKVIYFSGYTDTELIDVSEGDVIIWKPIKPEALIETIRECLAGTIDSGLRRKSA